MSTIAIATTEADAAAVTAVEHHHAEMAGTLVVLVERLVAAAGRGDGVGAEAARSSLVTWCRADLVPHAVAEEDAMYPPAHATTEGHLLVTGMIGEHRVITGLLADIEATRDPVRAAALATALRVMFDSHLKKENELVLPLLAGSREVSVATLLDGMHELLGGHDHHAHVEARGQDDPHPHDEVHGHDQDRAHDDHRAAAATPSGEHTCSCGEVDSAGYPELDARVVSHAIRHATIFGALDAVAPGGGLVLVAPHDPQPLLTQVEQREPGAFEVTYLERGPQDWRLQFVRRS